MKLLGRRMLGLVALLSFLVSPEQAIARSPAAKYDSLLNPASFVAVQRDPAGAFQYLVNGTPQTFIGMGYNPIYRYLSDEERAARYQRDFRALCEAGVNHITGWDADKGYEQDKFDDVTLDYAFAYGLGVVMPFYLPVDGDYQDEAFLQSLTDAAAAKIARFKDHPALRMWGVGNEVLSEMQSTPNQLAFGQFYLQLADLFHSLDPNHPVIYREAEDAFAPAIGSFLSTTPSERPWLLYGTNVYTPRIERILDDWPTRETGLPLIVSEFGAETSEVDSRAEGYVEMWREIRSHSDYVLGGAPYVWTTLGPEPTDLKWGLVDADGKPVDDTFGRLAAEWQSDRTADRCQALPGAIAAP